MPSLATIATAKELVLLTLFALVSVDLVAATPNQQGFAQCETKVQWMQTYWNSQWGNEAAYRANGVDGSEASIRAYLGNVEHFCPAVTTTTATTMTATSITTTTTRTPEPFAQCETKVQWMQTYWNSQWGNEASYRANGVDGSEASIRAYLGNVEHFCPAATTTTVSATDATATSTTTTTFTFEHTTTTTTEAPTTVEPTVIATTTNAPTSVTTTAASTSIGHTTKLKVLINGKVDELLTASSNSASNNDNAVAAGVDNTMTDPIVVVLGTLFVLGCLVVGAVVVKKQRKLSQHTITTDVEAAIPHRSLDNINYCMATSTTTTSGSTYDCVASVEEQMNGLPHYNTAA